MSEEAGAVARPPGALAVVRWLAGALLFACLALPLSRCEGGPAPGEGGTFAPREDRVFYPADHMDFGDWSGYLVLAAYTWPVAALGLRAIRRRRPVPALPILELLLSAGSVYLVYSLGTLGRRLIGGYLGIAAAAVYGATAAVEGWSRLREWKRGKRAA